MEFRVAAAEELVSWWRTFEHKQMHPAAPCPVLWNARLICRGRQRGAPAHRICGELQKRNA